MTDEYMAAIDAHNVALAEYRRVRDQYRARTIGDADFGKALAKKAEADQAFDRAFSAEQQRT